MKDFVLLIINIILFIFFLCVLIPLRLFHMGINKIDSWVDTQFAKVFSWDSKK